MILAIKQEETWEDQAKAELSTNGMSKFVKNKVEKGNAQLQRKSLILQRFKPDGAE